MSTPRRKRPAKKPAVPAVAPKRGALAADIRQMIEVARQQVAQAVNAGRHDALLADRRAHPPRHPARSARSMAPRLVSTLSRQLEPKFA